MTSSPARLCSRCSTPRDVAGQRYCRACKAAYMRDWRAKCSTRFHVELSKAVSDIVARHFPEAGRAR